MALILNEAQSIVPEDDLRQLLGKYIYGSSHDKANAHFSNESCILSELPYLTDIRKWAEAV